MRICSLKLHKYVPTDMTRIIPVFTGEWGERLHRCACGSVKWKHDPTIEAS